MGVLDEPRAELYLAEITLFRKLAAEWRPGDNRINYTIIGSWTAVTALFRDKALRS
jgi:hypothetical protein